MKTYFFQFKATPTINNDKYQLVEGAFASCWVLENDPETAVTKAAFQVSKYDWEITGLDITPIEVSEEHFTQGDVDLEQFRKAQTDGMSIVYMAWARDKKTSIGPITHKSSYQPDLQNFIKEQKRQKNRRRCLHFDADDQCQDIISAHSIQKSRLLSTISKDGHVYTLASDVSQLNKNTGMLTYQKKGINNVSTFLGFCKYHDNECSQLLSNFI